MSGSSLVPFVCDVAEKGSENLTDGWGGYNQLTKCGYGHDRVVLLDTSVPAHISLPGVHGIAALVKRWRVPVASFAPQRIATAPIMQSARLRERRPVWLNYSADKMASRTRKGSREGVETKNNIFWPTPGSYCIEVQRGCTANLLSANNAFFTDLKNDGYPPGFGFSMTENTETVGLWDGIEPDRRFRCNPPPAVCGNSLKCVCWVSLLSGNKGY